jgi:hypothetical protein
MSKDLLKEAIADAKAVRSTAIANAKLALEEAFTPKLQSMLSHKIAEEMDEELSEEDDLETTDTSMEDDEAAIAADSSEVGSADEETEMAEEMPADESYKEGEEVEEEMYEGDEEKVEEDLELESIIKELEMEEDDMEEDLDETLKADTEDPGANEKPTADNDNDATPLKETDDVDETEEVEEEEMDLDEIIKSLQEEDDMDELEETEEKEMDETKDAELEEAYKTIKYLKSKINEVNLLNSKLLYSNKLFRSNNLNESQKMKVIETFDRANSVREVKLVYSTLAESLTGYTPKKRVNENFASNATPSTKPSKDVIVESNTFANRMQRLAGLK